MNSLRITTITIPGRRRWARTRILGRLYVPASFRMLHGLGWMRGPKIGRCWGSFFDLSECNLFVSFTLIQFVPSRPGGRENLAGVLVLYSLTTLRVVNRVDIDGKGMARADSFEASSAGFVVVVSMIILDNTPLKQHFLEYNIALWPHPPHLFLHISLL